MPKQPQVSIKGEVYEKIKAHCKKTGEPIGAFVDRICTAFLQGEEPPEKPSVEKKQKKKEAAVKVKPPKKNGNKEAPDMKKLRF